jgi:dimethylamine/trimethylamine dehydrogenase
MDSEEYLRNLEEFFQGEVTGEALFHALAEVLEDPERRYQMRVLEQLERETKELLRENIGPLGGDIAESASARETGIAQAKALAPMPWAKVIHIFEREVRKFVAHFEDVEKAGPAHGAKLLAAVTAHERALLSFSERASAGTDNGCLDPVISLLKVVPARLEPGRSSGYRDDASRKQG